MRILFYIDTFSIILWIIIPFIQFKKKYFFYFFILAFMDIATLFLRLVLHSSSNYFYFPFSFLLFFSIQDLLFIKKYQKIIIILFILICFMNFNNFIENRTFFLISLVHFVILIKLLKDFIISFVKYNLFNIFILSLIFYEITLLTKFLNLLIGFSNADIYFIITSLFETFIGLFFCIFKSDNPRLLLQFK